MEIMTIQIRLSPYDLRKKLCLVIDGAKSVGTGFLMIYYINDRNQKKGENIIYTGSCLLPDDKDYSPVEAEAIALN